MAEIVDFFDASLAPTDFEWLVVTAPPSLGHAQAKRESFACRFFILLGWPKKFGVVKIVLLSHYPIGLVLRDHPSDSPHTLSTL